MFLQQLNNNSLSGKECFFFKKSETPGYGSRDIGTKNMTMPKKGIVTFQNIVNSMHEIFKHL